MILKLPYKLFCFILLIGIISCNSKTNNGSKTPIDSMIEISDVDSNLIKSGVVEKLDYAINNLRKSDDFIQILSKQTNLYDETVLNNIKKVHEYESSKSKALNLGVYGADLNAIIHFNQIPVSFKYLICAKQLADQIGVSMAFNKNAVDKFNGNVDQKDTLINIVSSAYDVIKKYLRNDDQFEMATLVMTGSWVENMHLTLNLVSTFQNESEKSTILLNIANQKEYLENLISLLTLLNEDNDVVIVDLIESLKGIDVVFNNVKSFSNKADFAKIKEKIELLRNKVVEIK